MRSTQCFKGALASYSTLFWDQPRQSFPFRDQGLNPLPFSSLIPIIFLLLSFFLFSFFNLSCLFGAIMLMVGGLPLCW